MKSRRLIARPALLATLLLPTLAHAQNAPPVPDAPKPAVPVPDAPKYLLRWRPQQGEVRVFRLKATQSIPLTSGAEDKQVQSFEVDYSQRIFLIEQDGSFRARVKFQAVRFSRASPTMRASFDSAAPPAKMSPEIAIYAALAGSQVTMRFDAAGKLLEVLDTEAFLKRILTARGVAPQDQDAVRESLRKSGESDAPFRSIGNTIASFPEAGISLGGSWPKRDPLGASARLLLDGSCTLSRIEGNRATLSLQSSVIPNPDDKDAPTNASGTQQGVYEIELSNGWTRSALLKQVVTLKGEGVELQVSSELSLRMLLLKAPGDTRSPNVPDAIPESK